MELIGRMLDGSIPYDPKGAEPKPGPFGLQLRQDDKIEHLQRVPLLSGCTQRQLRSIARIAEVQEVPAGTVLTRVGEPGQAFFLIVDGKVQVEVSARKRVRLGPGKFFGEMSMLDGGPRSATVVAETALRLLVIKRSDFSLLLSKASDLTRSLLTVLSQRVRQAEQAPHA
jgi:CRP-like cAMP-binding protein